MGLTGVIYAAIVVAWAIFLVPLALRRHDQASRNRSIERFSSTMRVLSSGGRRAGSRAVLSPRRPAERVVLPDAPTRPRGSDVSGVGRSPRPAVLEVRGASAVAQPVSRTALKAAARRRRRVLRVFIAVTLVTGASAVAGLIPVWSPAVPLVLICAFLILARRQVRIANESYWQRAARARAESSNVVPRSAARVDASHGVARREDPDGSVPGAGDGRDPADDEPTITLTDEQLAAAADVSEQRVVAISLPTADGGSLWDPLPITLPTYVDKPVAKRSVRKISIGEASTWSASHSAAADSPTTSAGGGSDGPAGATATGEKPGAAADVAAADNASDERPRAANA